VLIAVILVPLVLALSEGPSWGWVSLATIGCFVISVLGAVGFVLVEQRVAAPLVNLALLRNVILVGATLAILIVAGAINALMYILSLYFQNPAAFGLSPLEAGLATLPAAAAMIAMTPLITPLAVKIGAGRAVALGFGLAAVAFAALVFVTASWTYAAFVVPLVAIAAGLGLANGPASSASTAAVAPQEVGQASGISNMARYIGGSLFVAAVSTIYNAAANNHLKAGESTADALAAGLSRSSFLLAIACAAGVGLLALMARQRLRKTRTIDRAAAAAASVHTIPTEPVTS
jgi:Na+/melibiose symporter-like transporter